MIGSSDKYDQPTYNRSKLERLLLAVLTFLGILAGFIALVWCIQFYPAVMAVVAIAIVALALSGAAIYALYLGFEN